MKDITELEDVKKIFFRQAKTFRALAKVIFKDPTKKMEAKICEGLAEIIVVKESERDK